MTIELTYLALTAILLASLWIPFIYGNVTSGKGDMQTDFQQPPDIRRFPNWVQRSYRAHVNLVEQFAPYAVLVLLAHLLGVSTPVLIGAVIAFFWLRVVHAVIMIAGVSRFPARPIVFTAAWVAILVIAWEIFANAPQT